MHPDAVEYDVVRCRVGFCKSQSGYGCARTAARDLESHEAVMGSPFFKVQRAGTGFSLEFNLGHHVLNAITVEIRAAGKRGNPCITWSDAFSLGRQGVVGRGSA